MQRCTRSGVVIHVEVVGSGPPLVLVHGWAMHGGIFTPLVRALAGTRTLHVVDLPGHGFSGWRSVPGDVAEVDDSPAFEELQDWAQQLLAAVPAAPWLGWSLGGLVALAAALAQPARVPGVVAVATTPRFTRAHDWPCAMEASMLAAFASGLESDAESTVARFLALEAQGSSNLRDTLRGLREQLKVRPRAQRCALRAGLQLLGEIDLRAALPSLSVPTLWIGGRRDRLVPSAALSAAAGRAPDASSTILAQSGHAPFLTETNALVAAVLEWLQAWKL